jgi:hypothetical protein
MEPDDDVSAGALTVGAPVPTDEGGLETAVAAGCWRIGSRSWGVDGSALGQQSTLCLMLGVESRAAARLGKSTDTGISR